MSRNGVFIAASGWLALLSKNDEFHDTAREVLEQLKKRDCALITSSAVVFEVGDGLANRNQRQFGWLFRALLDSPKVEVVVIDATWLDAGWQMFKANPDRQWNLTDCLSFAIMRQYELRDAFAHDHHFEQAGFRALLRQN